MSICEEITKIRDFINSSKWQPKFFQDRERWSRICTCLDTIGDVDYAIKEFNEERSIITQNRYFVIYGLLQSLILQQDATGFLHFALQFDQELDVKKLWEKYFEDTRVEYPILKKIRNLRNIIVGHPTKNKKQKYAVINRNNINFDGFEYLVYNHSKDNEGKFHYFNFDEHINAQQNIVGSILSKINENLQKMDENPGKGERNFKNRP